MADEYQIDGETILEKSGTELRSRNIELLNVVNSSTDPTANGHVRLNGSDVKVYTGDSVLNLSDLGGALSEEAVEDLVAALITGDADVDVTYDDANDALTISLSDSVSVNDLTANTTFTDPAGITHSGELADNFSVSDGGALTESGPTDIDFATNLSVVDDGDGTVTVNSTVPQGVDVEDDGTVVVADTEGVNFGDNLSVTDDGDGSATINAATESAGGVYSSVTTVTTDHTTTYGEVVLADASAGAITVTLPAPDSAKFVIVHKVDDTSNPVTIATPGSETINGQSSASITAQYATQTVFSNGSNFWAIRGGDTSGTDQQVTTVTTDYGANDGDTVLADASSGAVTVTLPPTVNGIETTVKKIDGSANAVTLATPGGETIDGESSKTVTAQWTALTVTSDGSNYYIK